MIVQRNPTYVSGGGAAAATSQPPFLSQSYSDLSAGPIAPRRGGERRYGEARRFSTGGLTQPSDLPSNWLYAGEERQRVVSTSRERMSNLSIERLPEVPEEGRSQTSNLNIPIPTTRQVLAAAEQTTPTSITTRRISQPSQRSNSQDHTPSQKHLSCSQPGGLNSPAAQPPLMHVKQLSADLPLGKKLSLGSPMEGESDRNALLGLAMQSLTQSKMHTANQHGATAANYQPRSLYSSKLSTSSNGSFDSAYANGLSSRSLSHDERQSPPSVPSPQRISPDRPILRSSSSGAHSGSESPDQTDGAEEVVDWEVSVSIHTPPNHKYRHHQITLRREHNKL